MDNKKDYDWDFLMRLTRYDKYLPMIADEIMKKAHREGEDPVKFVKEIVQHYRDNREQYDKKKGSATPAEVESFWAKLIVIVKKKAKEEKVTSKLESQFDHKTKFNGTAQWIKE